MISHSVLTFDFGLRHTGVAIGQAITGTARGVMTLKCNDGQPQWHEIRALVETYAPTSLVVGLPLHMDGEESEMSSRVRAFAEELTRRYAMPVALQDERLTSAEAQKGLHEAGLYGQANTDHELAACIIAQDWLAKQTDA